MFIDIFEKNIYIYVFILYYIFKVDYNTLKLIIERKNLM